MKIFTTAVVAGVVALSVMFTGPQQWKIDISYR